MIRYQTAAVAMLMTVGVWSAALAQGRPDIAKLIAAKGSPTLVAKPYPGAVPEHTKDGKHLRSGDNANTYSFLTRDPIDKVRAFYAQEGIKLEPIAANEVKKMGGGRSNFEQALRYQLEDRPIGMMLAAPVEFYKTKDAGDTPSYFNAVAVMTGAQRVALQADTKGQQAVISDGVMGLLALSPETKPFVAIYGNIYMDPAKLVPLYNRHLAMLSGFYRVDDGNTVAIQKREEMRQRLGTPAASGGLSEDEMDAKRDAMRKEFREIMARKTDKRRQYQMVEMKAAQMKGMGDKDAKKKIQPELDQILMSDPELAAWKKRSNALEQQSKAVSAEASASQGASGTRDLRAEDVEVFLQEMEKEVYYTRILIHGSEGQRVKRDAATVLGEWKSVASTFGK